MPFGTAKNILEDLFSSLLLQFKKYNPSENLKFNDIGISQSLKLRFLMEKILPTFLKLNFTSNTLGCYGLSIYRAVYNTLYKILIKMLY